MAYTPADDCLENLSSEELIAKFGATCREEGRTGERHGIGYRTITEVGVDAYGEHMALACRAQMMQEELLCRLSGKKE